MTAEDTCDEARHPAGPVDVDERIRAIIDDRLPLRLPLVADGRAVGTLQPLTRRHLADTDVIRKLTDWRNRHADCFLTQFTASEERTRIWLRDVVLASTRTLLFLVHDEDNRFVGHFGFKSLTDADVLLDNAMRGERGGYPQLMVLAGRRLIDWLFAETPVKMVYGYVLANNIPAMMLNRQIGFTEWTRVPLVRHERGSELHWALASSNDAAGSESFCHRVAVHRGQWRRQ